MEMDALQSYFLATLVQKYGNIEGFEKVIYENYNFGQQTYEAFLKQLKNHSDIIMERRRYRKSLEREVINLIDEQQQTYGEHFFYRIFHRVDLRYPSLNHFATPNGDFGMKFIKQKYQNQCYCIPEQIKVPETKEVETRLNRHEEVVLYEIKLTIQKALTEKVINEREARELNAFIEELQEQKD